MTNRALLQRSGGERAEQRTSGVFGSATEPPPAHPELRLGAKALVRSGGRVLLVRERRVDGSMFWSLPGGGLEADESLPECLRREISEEIQCRSTVKGVVGSCTYCHTSRPTTTVYVVFETVLETEPEPNPGEAIVECAWVDPTDLPMPTLDPMKDVVKDATSGE